MRAFTFAIGALLVCVACGSAASTAEHPANRGRTSTEPAPRRSQVWYGKASWYCERFHGRKTASGERFDHRALTAAHRKLPFGTWVRVTNKKNGRAVVVRINDRGPYSGGRVIDLSRGAAQAVNMTETGIAPVKLEVLPSIKMLASI